MIIKIYQNVPICPECSALMIKRQSLDTYYVCVDCKKILKVISSGCIENELITTDGEEQ